MEHILWQSVSYKLNNRNFMYKKQNLNKNLYSDCTLEKRSPEMAFRLRNAGSTEYSGNTVKPHPLSKGDVSLHSGTRADLVLTLHCETDRA